MTKAEDLLALAERCEQATGLLAEEIMLAGIQEAWKLLNPRPMPWRVPAMADGSPWPGDGIGPYTPEATAWEAKHKAFKKLIDAGASLDAAMTLVPEGMRWNLSSLVEGSPPWRATIMGRHKSCAATPALALCAASLRSTAIQKADNHG